MRLNETSTLFRNEASGEMHGLIRVRQFTISEGHLACTPAQLEEEFKGCLDLAVYMLNAVGLGDYSIAIEFGILIVILLVKPAGLLGKARREKV